MTLVIDCSRFHSEPLQRNGAGIGGLAAPFTVVRGGGGTFGAETSMGPSVTVPGSG